MPLTTFLPIFKAHFNITTEPVMIVTGAKLQEFITLYGSVIASNDPDFAEQSTIGFEEHNGTFSNGLDSSQKWVKPIAGLLNPGILISLICYQNLGAGEEYFLRVGYYSIVSTCGYPGVTAP